jgi:hypothetical protein
MQTCFHLLPTLRLFEFIRTFSINHINLNRAFRNILPINLNTTPHLITIAHGANTLGRTRQHDIASLQRHNPADVLQLSWNPVKHQLRVVPLLDLIVHAKPQQRVVRVWNARFGNYVADGAESVEALCDGPGEALLFGFLLYVAGGEINGDEIA